MLSTFDTLLPVSKLPLRRRPMHGAAHPRREARVTLHILAEARSGGQHLVGWLLDLSTQGLFLRTSTPLPVGSRASLEFCLPESGVVIRCIGEALSTLKPGPLGPGGNRFRFAVMRPAHRRQLELFVGGRLATRRRPGRIRGEVEVSLLNDGRLLDDIAALPSGDVEVVGIDHLPDVGRFLQETSADDGFEPWNEVGDISPEDLVEVG